MKTLICVMAHKDAQDTFNRHFDLWRRLDAEMLVACPTDSKVTLPERSRCRQLEVAKAQHIGVQSIVRMRTILEHLNGQGFERYVFFEYDSFALELPEPRADVMAPVFRDNNPGRGFEGTMFLHPPIMFTAKGLAQVCEQIVKMPLTSEQSVWDRWLGLAIERAGVGTIGMLETGEAFAMNTIHEPQYPQVAKAVRNGAVFVHGVKTPQCLKAILDADRVRDAAAFVKQHGGTVEWKD